MYISKQAVLAMLRALAHALHGGLDAQLPALMADLRRCLQDKSQVGV